MRDTSRLFDAAANSIMNAATIFLGLSVGATMTSEAFLNWTTIGIVIGGFLAFALSITGGIFFVKLFNLFSKKKINPLIGATGLSAVPMASRVCNEIATKYDPKNHVLNYCMSSNISGVIGSAVAAGVLISFLGIRGIDMKTARITRITRILLLQFVAIKLICVIRVIRA